MTDVVSQRKDKAAKLLASGQVEAALSAYQQVVDEVPEDLTSRRMVAELHQKLGRRKEALATYEVLADAWARRGWLLRAVALCKIILQIEPRHERTQRLLADLYARQQGPLPVPVSAPPPAGSAPIEPAAIVAKPGTGKGPRFPVFSQLDGEEFLSLLEGLEMRFCQPGETIIEQGKPNTSMSAIVEGSMEVVRMAEQGGERTVAIMGEGNLFGEMALVSGEPRRSSVRAREPSVLLELTRARVEQLVMKHPAVGQVLQTFRRERLLDDMLGTNVLFRALPPLQREAMASEFQLCAMPADKPLIVQGKPVDALYVLLQGRCRVALQRPDGSETVHRALQEGDMFGEIALLLGIPATAAVTTDTSCTLLKLSREACERHLLSHPDLREQLSRMGSERLQRTAELLAGAARNEDDVCI